ncbi:hypothetical protein DFJ74DRAFT_762846 [Hyaloraphidium curvatum]|nr:hypothetical protein DFJ74DRAFT_762846 [Hyaloraphidium curvatum]
MHLHEKGVPRARASDSTSDGSDRSFEVARSGGAVRKKAKRHQVKQACIACRKACKKCAEVRPCMRCLKFGLECVDVERKRRERSGVRKPVVKGRKRRARDETPPSSPSSFELDEDDEEEETDEQMSDAKSAGAVGDGSLAGEIAPEGTSFYGEQQPQVQLPIFDGTHLSDEAAAALSAALPDPLIRELYGAAFPKPDPAVLATLLQAQYGLPPNPFLHPPLPVPAEPAEDDGGDSYCDCSECIAEAGAYPSACSGTEFGCSSPGCPCGSEPADDPTLPFIRLESAPAALDAPIGTEGVVFSLLAPQVQEQVHVSPALPSLGCEFDDAELFAGIEFSPPRGKKAAGGRVAAQ